MSAVAGTIRRGQRVGILCELVCTFDEGVERKNVIMRLREAGIISDQATDLLIEHFSLEAA